MKRFLNPVFNTISTLLLLAMADALQAQPCNCSNYLYHNGADSNFVEKFKVNLDATLTESGDTPNGNAWVNGNVLVEELYGNGS